MTSTGSFNPIRPSMCDARAPSTHGPGKVSAPRVCAMSGLGARAGAMQVPDPISMFSSQPLRLGEAHHGLYQR